LTTVAIQKDTSFPWRRVCPSGLRSFDLLGIGRRLTRIAVDENDNSRPIHCRWHIMSHSQQAIKSSSNLAVQPTSQLLAADELDYVVVVGGLLHRSPQIDSMTRDYLIEMGRSKVDLVGICTGSFILWRLGLLKSRKCCISWYHHRDFLEEFGDTTPIADQLYIVDGSRITCSGGENAAHLAAFLVDRHVGSSSAQKALRILQIDRARPAEAAQSAPLTDLRSEDDRISQSLLIMEQNLISPVPVARIASIVHTSPRQLERLFKEIVGCSPQTAYPHEASSCEVDAQKRSISRSDRRRNRFHGQLASQQSL
jgi:transcriptional regulator GlxA family with amidase domain